MKNSIFSSWSDYLLEILWSIRSVLRACWTSLPYLFSTGELNKEITEQYPDPISSKSADDLPPRFRGLLSNDIQKCTGCKECELACPTRCISIQTEPGADETKIWVSQFKIDFSRCIFCGLCTEVCIPQSLVHTKQYEGASYSLDALVVEFGRGEVTEAQRLNWRNQRAQAAEERGGLF